MPLPPATPRTLQHVRKVEVETYRRDDGLWDLEAQLHDSRPYEMALRSGAVRGAEEPIHHMRLRVTIDRQLEVVDVAAAFEASPYPGTCEAIASAYRKLVGLNLGKDFRRQVHVRVGAVRGCTHLSELSQVLPTAAIQALAGERAGAQTRARPAEAGAARAPSYIDRCHALARDGEIVRQFHPQWYVRPATRE